MQKKLTLRLDKRLIDYAKHYAEDHGTSVSRVVANYFAALSQNEQKSLGEKFSITSMGEAPKGAAEKDRAFVEELPPITRSLLGAFASAESSAPQSKRKIRVEYYDYLEEKHR